VKSATEAFDRLEKLQKREEEERDKKIAEEEEDVEEIVSEAASKLPQREEEKPESETKRIADIERIKAKALMRRAKARSEQGGWSVLQGAEEGTHPKISRYIRNFP
jgi:hypothetical protein